MLICERTSDFIMVEQYAHGLMCGDMARHWRDELFAGEAHTPDVMFAIAQHDRAWISLDSTPLWNDAKRAPYSFMDFPAQLKLPHYQQGIDWVQQQNPYAALLCSYHYASFFTRSSGGPEQAYYRHELERQEDLRRELSDVSDRDSRIHLAMLKFLDRLSIYICIHEPGSEKAVDLAAYPDGLVSARELCGYDGKLSVCWLDTRHVGISGFPFREDLEVMVPTRVVQKSDIQRYGMAAAYQQAMPEDVAVQIVRVSD